VETLIDSFLAMSNRDLWLAFAAVAIPFVVAFISQSNWDPLTKLATLVVTCIVASAGFVWAYDAFDTSDLPRLFLLLAVVAIAVYKLFHKPLTSLESKTSL